MPSKATPPFCWIDAQHRVDGRTVEEVDVAAGVDPVGVAAVAECRIVAAGVEPRDPARRGIVDDGVERAGTVAGPVVRSAERPGDDVHAVEHEPIDRSLELGGGRRGREEQFGAGRHVLDDLGDRDAVAVAHRGIDLPAGAQTLGDVGAELMCSVGNWSLLGDVPLREVEEIDDSDAHVAHDPRLLPRVSVGQLHFVSDNGS